MFRSAVNPFQTVVATELEQFRREYRQTLISGYGRIDRIVNYLTRSHGKGIRPTLTLLAASAGGSKPSHRAIRAAVIVELLHEATLVHDDVVDEAATRRGLPSLSAHFKNKVSVLFGDYMLANVLAATLEARDLVWLDILAETARRMARGELVQAMRSRRADMSLDEYLAMIKDKTAALFSAGCRLGAISAGLGEQQTAALGVYGDNLGMAFQIRDDLLDLFGDSGLLGKQTGNDLKQRKLTLPILAALNQAPAREARRMRARVRRGLKRGEVKLAQQFVRDYGGDKIAENQIHKNVSASLEALNSLDETPARKALADLAAYSVNRGN